MEVRKRGELIATVIRHARVVKTFRQAGFQNIGSDKSREILVEELARKEYVVTIHVR
jgi:hypothetical protein